MSTAPRTLADELRLAWREHRRYVGFAALLFALGIVAGAFMVGRFDLFGWMGLESPADLFPEDFGVLDLLVNNTRAFLLILLGVLTLGILTVFALVFNGIIIGYIGLPIGLEQGPLFLLVGLVPHGVFELGAFFVAGGISFRILKRTVDRIRGARDEILGRDGWRRTALLFVVAWVVLFVAAFIEMFVTATLLELLFA